jgi:hypothetical protein
MFQAISLTGSRNTVRRTRSMTDIVDRLRRLYRDQGTSYVQEAADTIERLRAECDAERVFTHRLRNQVDRLSDDRIKYKEEADALRAALERWVRERGVPNNDGSYSVPWPVSAAMADALGAARSTK